MPAYDPSSSSSVQGPPSDPSFDSSNDQPPLAAPGDAHLTPSHAFPPSGGSGVADPEHARAALSKSNNTSQEHHHHHQVETEYESCASCRAKGREPFQGHVDREEGCTCVVGE